MYYSKEELERLGFAHIGKNVRVFRQTVLVNPENIYLEDGCQIDDYVHIIASRPVRIGRRVHVACFTSISGGGEVTLQDYSGLSAGCRIISGTDDFHGFAMTNPCVPAQYRKVTRSCVIVGRHAILGANTIVVPGVTIGEGAAVSAGSFVTKDLPGWGIYRGTPLRRVKDRPSTRILELERLLLEEHGY